MTKDSEKPINLKVDKNLWKRVGTYAAKSEMNKKDVVEIALSQFLKSVGN